MKPQQAKRVKAAAAKRGRGTGHRAAVRTKVEQDVPSASARRLAAASDRMAAAARDLRREYVQVGNAGPDDVLTFVCCLDGDTYRVHPYAGDLISTLEAAANGVEVVAEQPEPESLTGDGDLREQAAALAAKVHGSTCSHTWPIIAAGRANHDGDHACTLDHGHGGDAHACDCGAFDLTEQGTTKASDIAAVSGVSVDDVARDLKSLPSTGTDRVNYAQGGYIAPPAPVVLDAGETIDRA